MDDIVVSILCLTYNHEAYVRQTFDGFLAQETSFRYEVVVHDDASTDGTAEIIREYQRKYPDIFFPIIQEENVCSRGIDIFSEYLMKKARGKYAAFCEGDDYWIDSGKLQMQYDVLEANEDVDICATGCVCLSGEVFEKGVCPSKENRLFTTDEVIRGGGGFVATASLFFRKKSLETLKTGLDYMIQIHGAVRGGMYYIAKNTCVYRINVKGSWTQRNNENIQGYLGHLEWLSGLLRQLDEETDYQFSDAIDEVILGFDWQRVRIVWNVDEMFDKRYDKFFLHNHWRSRLTARALQFMPKQMRDKMREALIKYEHRK